MLRCKGVYDAAGLGTAGAGAYCYPAMVAEFRGDRGLTAAWRAALIVRGKWIDYENGR
ncbi:MAG: hypothetical protein H5U08_05830 [Thermogutta sp.]|uniref:hypothetical protein n=1 Tax=Thermogutta sp. TaxID=1962930 RepID=UPI00199B8E00|nr:hypothetical protein [Thermogutta sp.]MBC7351859.1 hypothetical protein [Thermogutta sp.]